MVLMLPACCLGAAAVTAAAAAADGDCPTVGIATKSGGPLDNGVPPVVHHRGVIHGAAAAAAAAALCVRTGVLGRLAGWPGGKAQGL
jgi:hypothetical protein